MADEDKDWRGRAEDPTPEEMAEDLSDYINAKAEDFDVLRASRHEGDISFLGNDVIGEMLETLADISNYCTAQAIKLMMLQDHLEQDLSKKEGLIQEENIALGATSFKNVKESGWRSKQ